MLRVALVLLPAAGLVAFIAFVTLGWPVVAASVRAPQPVQPVDFDHQVHVEVAGMDCTFCHRTATIGGTAGYPDVEQCMFCHIVIGQGNPEIETVRMAWVTQEPIDWIRIHRMPDHVHFVHEAHVQAGIDCATCHGNVGQMRQAVQVRPLNMGDCVSCHREMGAPTDCATCHY